MWPLRSKRNALVAFSTKISVYRPKTEKKKMSQNRFYLLRSNINEVLRLMIKSRENISIKQMLQEWLEKIKNRTLTVAIKSSILIKYDIHWEHVYGKKNKNKFMIYLFYYFVKILITTIKLTFLVTNSLGWF